MTRHRRGRGEGSVYRRKDGSWVGSVNLGYDADGKRRRRDVYGHTKSDVLAKMTQLQQSAAAGTLVTPNRITIDEHFTDWLTTKRGTIGRGTYAGYESMYKTYIKPTFGHMQVRALDYRRINAWYAELDERGLSRRIVSYSGYLLRTALDDAVLKNIIPSNPSRIAAKRPSRRKEARWLNPDELRCFLDAAKGERLEDAFIFAVYTGLRPGEWMGLSWSDVDLDAGTVTVRHGLVRVKGHASLEPPKTRAGRRTLTLPNAALLAIRRQRKRQAEEKLRAKVWKDEWDLVFTAKNGAPLRASSVRRWAFARVCKAAGIENAHPHTLRHTNASILIDEGVRIKEIARRLGHDDIRTTLQTYGHLFPGQDEKAAEALDRFTAKLTAKPQPNKRNATADDETTRSRKRAQ